MYLVGYEPEAPKVKELDAFNFKSLEDVIQDLAVDNKQNRLIRENLLKSICHVTEIEPGKEVVKTMSSLADLERLLKTKPFPVKGIIGPIASCKFSF